MLRAMPFLAEANKLNSRQETHQALSAAVQRSHLTAVAQGKPPDGEKTIARNMHFSRNQGFELPALLSLRCDPSQSSAERVLT